MCASEVKTMIQKRRIICSAIWQIIQSQENKFKSQMTKAFLRYLGTCGIWRSCKSISIKIERDGYQSLKRSRRSRRMKLNNQRRKGVLRSTKRQLSQAQDHPLKRKEKGSKSSTCRAKRLRLLLMLMFGRLSSSPSSKISYAWRCSRPGAT